jgi:hypothetical protein
MTNALHPSIDSCTFIPLIVINLTRLSVPPTIYKAYLSAEIDPQQRYKYSIEIVTNPFFLLFKTMSITKIFLNNNQVSLNSTNNQLKPLDLSHGQWYLFIIRVFVSIGLIQLYLVLGVENTVISEEYVLY